MSQFNVIATERGKGDAPDRLDVEAEPFAYCYIGLI